MDRKTHNNVVVVVITSERTWHNLARYCFNGHFRASRDRVDLCIVFNGNVSISLSQAALLDPEYLLQRPNVGRDPAALDFALKTLPQYEYYLVLHDDHWFHVPHWLDYLIRLLDEDDSVDAYGNLITTCPYGSGSFESSFEQFCRVIMNDSRYSAEMFPHFLQGMAGIYRGRAIRRLLQRDGVPHTHTNDYKAGEVCERLFSYVLMDEGMVLKQIPPGYELYLRHRDHNQALLESILAYLEFDAAMYRIKTEVGSDGLSRLAELLKVLEHEAAATRSGL
ncbi:hypothetical protein [Geobacter sp. SVR]|uniref:hypothetical protein n=1 Tax=Geobacter sp. SVR TaxID=2495594 RepID=UPI00143EFC90|nr:hypothetical protein [Geobacter sp. SVR]BCS55995.1 hypothetical protein GSVR_43030 [Geobacter sp. SVR]GCF84758.1 hypothetical protein GSbR_13580 [Geobacter sp. SVR]